jgi:serine/alanine adding enzyme
LATHQIKYAGEADRELWDGYVRQHPDASLFHLFGWRDVIHATYGHKTHYLILTSRDEGGRVGAEGVKSTVQKILGVLPVVHLKHALFGNCLVSMPFLDGGGILADSREAEESLLSEVVALGRKIGASSIELRHERPLASGNDLRVSCGEASPDTLQATTRTDKVRMLLNLPGSSDLLMKSFKSKLRSQISKPLKEGLTSVTGGVELLDEFYRVFLVNMRDLGSPVHSMRLMRNVLDEFSKCSRIVVVYKGKQPVAAAFVVGFNQVLRNPWASALRAYAALSPNMLLYLRMLEYACDNAYHTFDFGRSTAGEGTYKFKEQWGASPAPLYWHYFSLDGKVPNPEGLGKGKFEKAIRYWQRLPLFVTRIIGPSIRKHISL